MIIAFILGMKHIKQKENQCWLASVCMIEDLDYEYYSRYYPTTGTKEHIDWIYQLIQSLAFWYNTQSIRKLSAFYFPFDLYPDLTGRGIIILGDNWGHHAVAFADGLIYNPNQDNPCSWDEFVIYFKSKGRELKVVNIQLC